MLEVAAILGTIGLLVCLLDWRKGIFVMALVGILQDPLRKIVPGEPVYLTLAVGLFFVATVLGRALRIGRFPIAPIIGRYRSLAWPVALFVMLFTIHLGWTLLKYRSVALAGIAVIAYLVPIVAVALGYNQAVSYADPLRPLARYCSWYVALVVAAASGIVLDYLGVSSPLFEQVGRGIVITDFGESFRAYSGLFRSPEIAGWHVGAAICLLLCLWVLTKRVVARGVISTALLFLLLCAMLTGRRKVVMLVVLFLAFFGILLLASRFKVRPLTSVALVALAAGIGLGVGNFFDLSSPDERANLYLRRTGTVFADAGERFELLGLGSIGWSLKRNGLWGVGAGVASSGAQHFGGGVGEVGGGAEGGLGKITAEFGVPGLILTLWILFAIGREGWRMLKEAAKFPTEGRTLEYGLLAFLAANVPVFVVASPAYGDLFVILTLGLFAGFAAGLPARIAVVRPPPASVTVPLKRHAPAPPMTPGGEFRPFRLS